MDAKRQSIDTELRAILVEHQVEEQAWRLEKAGIMRKSDLQKIWSENLFGEEGYSRDSLEILKKDLHEYGPSGAGGGTNDVVDAGTNIDVAQAGGGSESEEDSDSEDVTKARKGEHYRIWVQ